MKYFYFFNFFFLFSVHIASPFFVVYQLKILKLDYFLFSLLLLVGSLVSFLFGKYWGKAVDKYGPKTVLFSGALLVSSVPFIYYFYASNFFVLLLTGILSGLG